MVAGSYNRVLRCISVYVGGVLTTVLTVLQSYSRIASGVGICWRRALGLTFYGTFTARGNTVLCSLLESIQCLHAVGELHDLL